MSRQSERTQRSSFQPEQRRRQTSVATSCERWLLSKLPGPRRSPDPRGDLRLHNNICRPRVYVCNEDAFNAAVAMFVGWLVA